MCGSLAVRGRDHRGNVALTNSRFLKNVDLILSGCRETRTGNLHRSALNFFPCRLRHSVTANLMSQSKQKIRCSSRQSGDRRGDVI